MEDGYVSVSVLGIEPTTTPMSGDQATGLGMAELMAAFEQTHCP